MNDNIKMIAQEIVKKVNDKANFPDAHKAVEETLNNACVRNGKIVYVRTLDFTEEEKNINPKLKNRS